MFDLIQSLQCSMLCSFQKKRAIGALRSPPLLIGSRYRHHHRQRHCHRHCRCHRQRHRRHYHGVCLHCQYRWHSTAMVLNSL